MAREHDITFGPFRLEMPHGGLWRGAHSIALRPRSRAMLRYLVEHPGRLVTKAELHQQVWAGTHVTDAVLRVSVREIRAALGDSAVAPRYLETVGRQGYRWLAGGDLELELTSALPPAAPTSILAKVRPALRDLGWVEGQNLVIETRWAEGSLERFATLAAEVVRLPVGVIVVPNMMTARVAYQVTRTIPIVVASSSSPVRRGLVASLRRPGGNITGLATLGPELYPKRLELLTSSVPGVTRVAVVRGLAGYTSEVQALEGAARALGVRLQLLEVQDPTAFDRAFATAIREQAGALVVLGDPFFFPYPTEIAELALKSRLPWIFTTRLYVDVGGFMSYGPSLDDLGQRLASYIDKILKGAKPADLPMEQPTTFEFVINLKTAKELGLTIPPSLLVQATEVIR
jgi:ABC-type uncharacterized transport system substrate-binding protein